MFHFHNAEVLLAEFHRGLCSSTDSEVICEKDRITCGGCWGIQAIQDCLTLKKDIWVTGQ